MFFHEGYAALFSPIQYHIHVHITIIYIQPHDACVELIAYYFQAISCFFCNILLKKRRILDTVCSCFYIMHTNHNHAIACQSKCQASKSTFKIHKRQQSHAWSMWSMKHSGVGNFDIHIELFVSYCEIFKDRFKKQVGFPKNNKSRKNDCPRT